MNKYHYITQKPYHRKSWACFSVLLIAISICCVSMLFNLTDRDKLIFQILSFILVDFTICINYCYIEAKFVFDYADSNILISEFSKERLKKGKAFNAYLKLSFALITCFSVVTALLVKSNYRIDGIKTLILVLQSIYLMPFLIFTTYYLKLITAFGENNFLADMSLIEYKKNR